jgi:hypothetical protein
VAGVSNLAQKGLSKTLVTQRHNTPFDAYSRQPSLRFLCLSCFETKSG